MSDLVGNPEDRFSRVAAQLEDYDKDDWNKVSMLLVVLNLR